MGSRNAGTDLEATVALLRCERTRLQAELDDLGDKVSVTSWDGHDAADLGTMTAEREQSAALLDQSRQRLAQVEHALAKVDQGLYGYCEICGEAINPARLEVLPATTRCRDHGH